MSEEGKSLRQSWTGHQKHTAVSIFNAKGIEAFQKHIDELDYSKAKKKLSDFVNWLNTTPKEKWDLCRRSEADQVPYQRVKLTREIPSSSTAKQQEYSQEGIKKIDKSNNSTSQVYNIKEVVELHDHLGLSGKTLELFQTIGIPTDQIPKVVDSVRNDLTIKIKKEMKLI